MLAVILTSMPTQAERTLADVFEVTEVHVLLVRDVSACIPVIRVGRVPTGGGTLVKIPKSAAGDSQDVSVALNDRSLLHASRRLTARRL